MAAGQGADAVQVRRLARPSVRTRTSSSRRRQNLTWQARPGDGHPVTIDVSVDDTPLISIDLPGEAVGPGEQATVHFPFRAPDTPGVHRVAVDLVHAGITRFSDQNVSPWSIDITVADVPPTPTTRLFELQRQHNPWRYDPFCGVARSRDGHPFPVVIADARGCRVWDLEGHEFLDYQMGSGSTILGHADERIQEPVRRTLGMGSLITWSPRWSTVAVPMKARCRAPETGAPARGCPVAELVTWPNHTSDVRV